jgi:predicted AAA+ superfamily ATPase
MPHESVFSDGGGHSGDVLDLTDLIERRINAEAFFDTNYVTDGMETLLREAFRCFSRGLDSEGVFLLTQAMGGGKTHNMIALGLLAQTPDLRERVMGSGGPAADVNRVRVAAFTGRESDAPFGIWGELADQLGKRSALSDYYEPLQAPGQMAWVELLQGEPLLILLDELPPYLNATARCARASTKNSRAASARSATSP